MVNAVIYYHQNQDERFEQAVENINKLIKQIETQHVIKGVFLDSFNERNELVELINSPLSEIDYLFLNKIIEDEFDKQLISELSKTEDFELIFFDLA